jgi:hypothetical protein
VAIAARSSIEAMTRCVRDAESRRQTMISPFGQVAGQPVGATPTGMVTGVLYHLAGRPASTARVAQAQALQVGSVRPVGPVTTAVA